MRLFKKSNEMVWYDTARGFHRVVLTSGSVPLDILEDLVKQYIAETKSA